MKRLIVLAALALTACSTAPAPGHAWQVTDIYTAPGEPPSVSGEAAGAVQLVLGESSATGSTGCAPIQADIAVTEDTVEFTSVRIPELGDMPCQGRRAWAHQHMSSLLVDGAVFDRSQPTDTEMVLTLRGEDVDRPALRLAAW